MEHDHTNLKHILDVVAAALAAFSFAGVITSFAAIASLIWTGLRIVEMWTGKSIAELRGKK